VEVAWDVYVVQHVGCVNLHNPCVAQLCPHTDAHIFCTPSTLFPVYIYFTLHQTIIIYLATFVNLTTIINVLINIAR